MAGQPEVRSIRFLKQSAAEELEILVRFKDGGESSFLAATPGRPAAVLRDGKDFFLGPPMLFVAGLDEDSIQEAVGAMASDIGGFWLRYYNKPRSSLKTKRTGQATRLADLGLTDEEGGAEHGSANVQARLDDGRQFSILAATPPWFEQAFEKNGLRYYFGPAVLFLRRMESALARKAVQAMARHGDQWFCRYDTPRTTLSRVLSDFRAAHP